MSSLKELRENKSISQRDLASRAGISYKTLQLIEAGAVDPKVSTLKGIARALGYPVGALEGRIQSLWSSDQDSIAIISEHILEEGAVSWKTWIFNFVDAYRACPDCRLIALPPHQDLASSLKALLASTVEALCAESKADVPDWCPSIPPLRDPWFPSEVENLKSMALVESSVYFRKRNIFVLSNFLARA